MRIIQWVRSWVSESVAMQVADRSERHCVLIAEYVDDLTELVEKLRAEVARLAGPSPASDGLSLAVLRDQICRLEQITANHKASIVLARDAADARGKRIAVLESTVTELAERLAHFEDKFAARTDTLCAPSRN